ncbi:MAG: preprotein translocase subunit SecG [Arsenophonus sp.]
MYTTLLVIFLLVSISLICMIIMQQWKNSNIGGSCVIGSSVTLFGSSGSNNIMTRITAIFATLFFVISLLLGNLTYNKNLIGSKWKNIGESFETNKSTKIKKKSELLKNDIPY